MVIDPSEAEAKTLLYALIVGYAGASGADIGSIINTSTFCEGHMDGWRSFSSSNSKMMFPAVIFVGCHCIHKQPN